MKGTPCLPPRVSRGGCEEVKKRKATEKLEERRSTSTDRNQFYTKYHKKGFNEMLNVLYIFFLLVIFLVQIFVTKRQARYNSHVLSPAFFTLWSTRLAPYWLLHQQRKLTSCMLLS